MSSPGVFEIWITAFFTLALFSFLYKDNPIYKVAEYIFAGLTAGYQVGLIWDTIILAQLWNPLTADTAVTGSPTPWWLIVPGILGLLMFFRLWPSLSWASRVPLAFVFGVTSGIFLISQLHGLVLPQIQNTMEPMMRTKVALNSGYENGPDALTVVAADASASVMDTSAGDTMSTTDTVSMAEMVLPQAVTEGSITVPPNPTSVQPARLVVGEQDSIVLTATFTDGELAREDMYRVGWKLRSESGEEFNVLSPNSDDARLKRGDVEYESSPDGTVTVRYVWPVDTSMVQPGQYDVTFDVQRDRVMVVLWIVVVIGVVSTLLYFYFSHEHKGILGGVAKVGVWFIMISFGAHFGFTVMGRVSLLIGRTQFLVEHWIVTSVITVFIALVMLVPRNR